MVFPFTPDFHTVLSKGRERRTVQVRTLPNAGGRWIVQSILETESPELAAEMHDALRQEVDRLVADGWLAIGENRDGGVVIRSQAPHPSRR